MSSGKILLVEDDEFLRDMYLENLTAEGYTTETAVDGESALTKIKQGGFDLVLLDIILPKASGLDVMRQVRALPTQPANGMVIFLTNLDKDEEIKEALTLGDGYLIKSQLTPEDMLKEVNMYMAKVKEREAQTPPVQQ